jgi:RNA polymerase sigma factor (sigma-70 family)
MTPGDDAPDGELLGRFARGGDAAAFEQLVRRHGPMVLGVCRRVLRDAHAADDAFQATFLLLVRKAGSLRRPNRLGPWLHGVAYRTALHARARAARRPEGPVTGEPIAPPAGDPVGADLRLVLDAAIDRLPARERAAVVLCYLEGVTYTEAARRLGCPLGTLAARLSRARDRLRVRLTRQGLAPTAGLLSAGIAADAPAVSPDLITATVRAAASLAAGAAGAVAGPVIALMTGVRRTMLLNTLKAALATLTVLMAIGAGVGTLVTRALATGMPSQAAPPALVARTDVQRPDPAGKPREEAGDIPLAALRQKPPDVYLLDAGDVLGIYVEGILGTREQPVPVINAQPGAGPGLPLAFGYPIPVKEDGTIMLPLIAPITVRGKSTTEAQELVRQAYIRAQVLVRGKERVIISMARKRTYRVTVVRRDVAASSAAPHLAPGYGLDLLAYENDVLTALAQSGGVPSPEATAVVVIQRSRTPTAADATGTQQVRIPLRRRPGEPLPFRPEDVVLQTGDVVIVEADSAADSAAEAAPSGGTPPIMSLAVAAPDGRVLVQMPAASVPPRRRDDGTATAAAPAGPAAGQWQLFAAAQLRALETDGRPIDGTALAERLRQMTAVLVATDGRPPEAFYLHALKPGTPVLIVQDAAASAAR